MPSATYFVTCCTKNRTPVLLQSNTARIAQDTLQGMHVGGDVALLAATIMPDHVHLLFTLGARLQVGQVMGKFKAKTRDFGKASWYWQEDGFEHQLRSSESIEDYGFHIFMNPYRAGLCALTDPWPTWLCPQPSGFRFLAEWDASRVVPKEWLALRDQVAARIKQRG